MTVIVPTIGRIVWYTPLTNEPVLMHLDRTHPMTAQVCYVNPDGTVNLLVTDHMGNTTPRTGVELIQENDGAVPASGNYCQWMPYQQAAQARADEAKPSKAKVDPSLKKGG
jgi:hypothetical protein